MNKYALAVVERLTRTFAGSLAVTLGAGTTDVIDMPWESALRIAIGVTLLEGIVCVAAGRTGPVGPGLMETVPPDDKGRP